jgi:hypothetical protein
VVARVEELDPAVGADRNALDGHEDSHPPRNCVTRSAMISSASTSIARMRPPSAYTDDSSPMS